MQRSLTCAGACHHAARYRKAEGMQDFLWKSWKSYNMQMRITHKNIPEQVKNLSYKNTALKCFNGWKPFLVFFFFLNCIWADSLNTELQPMRQKYQLRANSSAAPIAVMILIKAYCDKKGILVWLPSACSSYLSVQIPYYSGKLPQRFSRNGSDSFSRCQWHISVPGEEQPLCRSLLRAVPKAHRQHPALWQWQLEAKVTAQTIPAANMLCSNLWQNATGATTQAGECEEEESSANGNKRLENETYPGRCSI